MQSIADFGCRAGASAVAVIGRGGLLTRQWKLCGGANGGKTLPNISRMYHLMKIPHAGRTGLRFDAD